MSQSPDKWDTFRRNLQALIIGLVALTAGAFVEVLGLTALAFIWLGLFAIRRRFMRYSGGSP